MLSSVLNSQRAVQKNIVIIRAFVKLREVLDRNRALTGKVARLEAEQRENAARLTLVVQDVETLARNVSEEFKRLQEPPARKGRFGFLAAFEAPAKKTGRSKKPKGQ